MLASQILGPNECSQWNSMRAVDKRRHEWLLGRYAAKQAVQSLLKLDLRAIEIVSDPYGRPQVKYRGADPQVCAGPPGPAEPAWTPAAGLESCPTIAAISIAHSQGKAAALAVLNPQALVGIDLESLHHRREDFAAIAFSPDERRLLSNFHPELRQEWALRMWCAKEAAGKAIGRGLSAGLLAFHITCADPSTGTVEIELRDGALSQCPQLEGESLPVYTARKPHYVFSAIIYEQGAVRMRPSRQEILDYLLQKMGELTEDWDYPDPVRPESKLFTELGFESLDAVVLCTAIQEHYQKPMPFAELLAEIGQQQRDLSINELTDFVNTHLGSPAVPGATRRVQ
jgi:phosphopantetheinyl transferase/acyl carrier protein